LTNARQHYGRPMPDEFASQAAMIAPRTWLLQRSLLI
jgi:hypothetical protein